MPERSYPTRVRVDPLIIKVSELQRERDKKIQQAWEAFEEAEADAWRRYHEAFDALNREESHA